MLSHAEKSLETITSYFLELRSYFASGSFFLFFLYLLFGNRLEPYFFFNEFFSLLGLIFFITGIFKLKDFNHTIPQCILFFMIYGFLRALLSAAHIENTMGYFRSLVLWFSVFSFFVGVFFVKYFSALHQKNTYNKSAIGIGLITIIMGNTIVTVACLPFIFRFHRFYFLWVLAFLFCIYALTRENTVLAMVILFGFLGIFLKTPKLKKLFFNPIIPIFLVVIFFIFVYSMKIFLYNFYFHGYEIFYDKSNDSTWRFMFWCYVFFHQVLTHPLFGIGFGTPIVNMQLPETHFIWATDSLSNPLFSYVLGTHNFLMDITARLGIFGLLPIVLIYVSVWKKMRYEKSSLSNALFLSFMLITVGASFNVVLFTPKYASAFWIVLGMLYESFNYSKQCSKGDSDHHSELL